MYDKGLKELELISQAVGNLPEYVQGGGGNTSVKLSDELMAVKASGFKLKQITPKEGYVVINYKNIKNYYCNVDLSQDRDYEKESVDFAKSNLVEMEGIKVLRPSVEAGFHSILKKYVIHTHPVYANILCCSIKGGETVEKLFGSKEYAFLWIPYINPGFCLTLKIKEETGRCIEKTGKFPEVIFMENHGLIVSSDDCRRAVKLHAEVNDIIRDYLGIKEAYPEIKIERVDEDTYISRTQYLTGFFKGRKIDNGYFDRVALYPDQLVYLNGGLSINGPQNKLNINTSTGELVYKVNYQEALTMEETLLGYLYVVNGVENSGLGLKAMSGKEMDFIRNWESESYRKSLVKNPGR